MFKHGKTNKPYFSVREKINYYSDILKGKKAASPALKAKAAKRLPELKQLDERSYKNPTIIVTDDKHFGNKISKPRACVVVGQDNKGRLLVCPVHKRTTSTVILDNDISHQVDGTIRRIDRSDVYETKNISGLAVLSENDKKKLKDIHKQKEQ